MLEGPDTAQSEVYASLERALREGRISRQPAHAGADLLGFEPARLRLLGPVAGEQDNNASVVMQLSYGAVDILLSGDLEAEGEQRLLALGALRDIEVLKLGHHGSRTSSSEPFLRALRPEIGLISVGRNNRYRHPAPQVLSRLAADGIVPLRTDQLGTLWLRTDGRRIQLYRYAGP
jgi:competence protein ComEC